MSPMSAVTSATATDEARAPGVWRTLRGRLDAKLQILFANSPVKSRPGGGALGWSAGARAIARRCARTCAPDSRRRRAQMLTMPPTSQARHCGAAALAPEAIRSVP